MATLVWIVVRNRPSYHVNINESLCVAPLSPGLTRGHFYVAGTPSTIRLRLNTCFRYHKSGTSWTVTISNKFPHADQVRVKSGRDVVVFNVGGNKYRLITAIHYDRGRVYTLMILSHEEYSQDRWKDIL